MQKQYNLIPELQTVLSGYFVECDGLRSPLERFPVDPSEPVPQDLSQLKILLRSLAPALPIGINKDPLDQYLFEACGKIYENVDSIIIEVKEYWGGTRLDKLHREVITNPYTVTDFEHPYFIGNYIAELIINDTLYCVQNTAQYIYHIRERRTSRRAFFSGAKNDRGEWYSKNPNTYNIAALERSCKQLASQADMFVRLATHPYDLLVLSRDVRPCSDFNIPNTFEINFDVPPINDELSRKAANELDEGHMLIPRRVYDFTGDEAELQLFDFKGRLLGEVPADVQKWLKTAIDEAYVLPLSGKVTSLKLDSETNRVLSFKASIKLASVKPNKLAGWISYVLIKSFAYPDERPTYYARRFGLTEDWINPITTLYRVYQENPQKLGLSEKLRRAWSELASDGVIDELKAERQVVKRDMPIPADLLGSLYENAAEHYSTLLADSRILRYNEDRARALTLRGKAYLEEGYTVEAMEDFTKAEQLISEYPKLDLMYLAHVFIGQGKIHAANGDLQRAASCLGKAAAVLEKELAKGRVSILPILIPLYIMGADVCKQSGERELELDALGCGLKLIRKNYAASRLISERTGELYLRYTKLLILCGRKEEALKELVTAAELYELLIIRRECEDFTAASGIYLARAQLLKEMGFLNLSIQDKKRAAQISSIIKRRAMQDVVKRIKRREALEDLRDMPQPELKPEDLPPPPREGAAQGVPQNPQRREVRGTLVFEPAEDTPPPPPKPTFLPDGSDKIEEILRTKQVHFGDD
ncbi:MAG: hypothetical protein LBS74_11595 [Oscillospiraceae bacterium]|nr:hypothetical protein [Oscillospiraceae bacterium]